MTTKSFLVLAGAACFAAAFARNLSATPPDASGLAWDVEAREYTSKPGERYAEFKFWFTNSSASEVSLVSARGSCSCTTVAPFPETPWPIAPGATGSIDVKMDLAGKSGTVAKGVMVTTSAGMKNLTVKTVITPALAQASASMNDAERLKNMQTALADRQAIFKKADCASCHAEPANGKTDGAQLYAGVCANCHDSPHRASTVPDLRTLKHATDAEHWRKWITHGRAGSMMPAFTESEGGPLNQQQIEAIVAHLVRTVPSQSRAAGQSSVSAAGH